ncbi:type I-E CRISPR-associated protein Cas7/Cse4/CasC [[Pseudomonas] boreopolis]|uniref:type I-E CRISPR-associated protein Cas7/Cse4/CasC n=1 Tax=Xanthomonas boreopolis TaxID=86183 RepID=UPI003DA127DC
MSTFIEFHLIQNFAPSNLNRDDTGAPKDAIFGGHRRARVSSQCQKKTTRDFFKTSGLVGEENLGIRTRHLDRVLLGELKSAGLTDPSKFNEIIKQALKSKDKKDESGKSDDKEIASSTLSYLLFVSATEIEALKRLVGDHAEMLKELSEKKKIKPSDVQLSFRDELKAILRRSKAVDVALFGRMLADLPIGKQDAACQVAHAISTHRVEREFDYFTAVDDKGDEDETGAGMIGQVEFNSATFYRYAVLDVNKLFDNLQGDRELALSAIEAFTQALVRAIPSGKQNSFAAHNPPEFIGISLRHATPLNLANAFEKPVRPKPEDSLTAQSVGALASYEDKLAAIYATPLDQWLYLDLTGRWPQGKGEAQKSLPELARRVRELSAAGLGE